MPKFTVTWVERLIEAVAEITLALSTYLGHAKVADTYLEAVPELMTDIADRCERFVMGGRS